MGIVTTSVLLSVITTAAAAATELSPHFVTTFPLKNVAVTAIADPWPGSKGPALLVTTFSPFGSEPVSYVSDLAAVAKEGAPALAKTLEEDTPWNNYVGMAPSEVGDAVVVTAGGFLVPGHSTGSIDLFDATTPSHAIRTQVSTDKKGWFYHKIVWNDMDGDGKLDIVAARATVPMTSGAKPEGELLWLKQPAINATNGSPWVETVVVAGPDVDFIMEDLDGDGQKEVIAAQFFSAPQLAVYSCEEKTWSLCNSTSVKITVIDAEKGPFFTVRTADLNNDGKKELLVSNNQDDGTGSVFAFEPPVNARGDTWVRHELATGFKPYPSIIPSPGAHSRGAPGTATAFHAETSKVGKEKPRILLSGDDGGFVTILTPSSEDDGDWSYSNSYLCNSTGTMGSPSIYDVDGDGFVELFIPFYSAGKMEIYNFSTAAPAPVNPKCQACLDKKDPAHLSPDYVWCYKDSVCHLVGSIYNPCKTNECASGATVSQCQCSSCNDGACNN